MANFSRFLESPCTRWDQKGFMVLSDRFYAAHSLLSVFKYEHDASPRVTVAHDIYAART